MIREKIEERLKKKLMLANFKRKLWFHNSVGIIRGYII